MTDRITKEKRSALMSRIHSKNTGLEKRFRRLLKINIKKKFETNVREIHGNPDFVFKKEKLCVFIDGDFWHGWQYPRWKHKLKNNFWRNKIEKNRKRDLRVTRYLRNNGWKVLRFWAHHLDNNPQKVSMNIKRAISQQPPIKK
jgi:DNA mismatch endonuclease, patch repair protein